MPGLRGLSGLPKRLAVQAQSIAAVAALKTAPPRLEPRRVFQERFLLRRRGPRRGRPVGQSPEEQRAAQDVQWGLPQRIVLQALRNRHVSVLFSDDGHTGGEPQAAGWSVDFMVLVPLPPLAFDVLTDETQIDRLKEALLREYGYRYGWLLTHDALASDAVLSDRLDRLLGMQEEEAGSLAPTMTWRTLNQITLEAMLHPSDVLFLP